MGCWLQIQDLIMKPDIIYEDDGMIICRKPAGVLAQGSRSFDADMVSMLMTYRRKKGEDTYIGVINRLDRPVEGLMVFAKSSRDAARLNRLMQQDTFNKTYIAVVWGCIDAVEGTLTDYLVKNAGSNTSHVASEGEPGAKRAELNYRVIGSLDGMSVVRIQLVTGRHHQIRVQFASRGHALVGDAKYGSNSNIAGKLVLANGQIALCACAVDVAGRHYETEPSFLKIAE